MTEIKDIQPPDLHPAKTHDAYILTHHMSTPECPGGVYVRQTLVADFVKTAMKDDESSDFLSAKEALKQHLWWAFKDLYNLSKNKGQD